MATEVKLPRLGQGMESGTIVKWLKGEGEPVKKREPLYELDTDKVTQEVESDLDGVLLKIVVPEGEVEVGSTIAVIEAADGAAAEADSPPAQAPAAAAPEPPPEPEAPAQTPVPAAAGNGDAAGSARIPEGGRIKASPLARRIARERGLDLATLTGTGPDGRIVAEDVERAQTGGVAAPAPSAAPLPAAGEVEVVAMTSIRKTIARRLTEAWTAPVFQLGVSIDMTEALHLREQLVARIGEGDVKPTVNDLLTKLVGVALARHRAINATFDGTEIHRHPAAHVGIAVAAPNGLVVPVIRDVDRKGLLELAAELTDLSGKARAGKLAPKEISGAVFTISSLGGIGGTGFTPIVNLPQVAILGVVRSVTKPVWDGSQFVPRLMLPLSLSYDHRVIDGAAAARFCVHLAGVLKDLRRVLL